MGVVLKVFVAHLYYKVATFELEMRKWTSRTTHMYYKAAIFELQLRVLRVLQLPCHDNTTRFDPGVRFVLVGLGQ